ncbi:MAG: dienelactone hydrolase family protein [Bryobacteraceae bacterium]|nr:dienelactone hydrolase family protein [Bryobacteraceae bacterium]
MSVNRREFLTQKLAAGFALAVQPIAAYTITTDTNGLVAGEVRIPTSDGDIPAYRAQPAKGKNFATVLVVQEIFGVHEHIRDVCRRLAKLGFMAVAPELYARQGDVSQMEDFQTIIREVVSKVPDDQVMTDLDAAAAWAEKNGGDPNRLTITGFCWGGRIVWLYAAHNPNLKAGAAWYGKLTGAASETTPKQPVDVAGDLKAPVIGMYAGKDTGIGMDQVDAMRAAISKANGKSRIQLYNDAGHGFHADYRSSYREGDAKDAWQRMLIWFRQHKAG